MALEVWVVDGLAKRIVHQALPLWTGDVAESDLGQAFHLIGVVLHRSPPVPFHDLQAIGRHFQRHAESGP